MDDFGTGTGDWIGAGHHYDNSQPAEPSHPFGFNPDVNLTFDWRSVLDKHLDDPGKRLDFYVHQSKMGDKQTDLSFKRALDRSSTPLIEQDIQENQKHLDEMNQHLTEMDRQLKDPIPLRHMAQQTFQGTLAEGVAALFGAKLPNVIAAGQENAQRRTDVDDTNALNKWQQEHSDLQAQHSMLQQKIASSEAYGRQLRGEQIGAAQTGEQRQYEEKKAAEKTFETASTESGIRSAAQTLGIAEDDPRFKAAMSDLTARRSSEGRMERSQLLAEESSRGGLLSDDEALSLQKEFDSNSAKYGFERHTVINSPDWKAEAIKSRSIEVAEREKRIRSEFDTRMKFQEKSHKDQMAHWAAQLEVAREHIVIDRDRFSLDQVKAAEGGLTKAYTGKNAQYQQQIVRKQAELAAVQGGKHADNQTRQRLGREIAGLKAAQQENTSEYKSAIGGGSEIDKSDPGSMGGGGARVYQGYEYQVGADGKWHRGRKVP